MQSVTIINNVVSSNSLRRGVLDTTLCDKICHTIFTYKTQLAEPHNENKMGVVNGGPLQAKLFDRFIRVLVSFRSRNSSALFLSTLY